MELSLTKGISEQGVWSAVAARQQVPTALTPVRHHWGILQRISLVCPPLPPTHLPQGWAHQQMDGSPQHTPQELTGPADTIHIAIPAASPAPHAGQFLLWLVWLQAPADLLQAWKMSLLISFPLRVTGDRKPNVDGTAVCGHSTKDEGGKGYWKWTFPLNILQLQRARATKAKWRTWGSWTGPLPWVLGLTEFHLWTTQQLLETRPLVL